MTQYVVWCPDYGHEGREDGVTVESHSLQGACEKWAELSDSRSADYLIVGGNSAVVMVAEVGSKMPPFRFSVSGESVPLYRAQMLHSKPVGS
jgi:hypothetical protein